jgi:hypothetical protein
MSLSLFLDRLFDLLTVLREPIKSLVVTHTCKVRVPQVLDWVIDCIGLVAFIGTRADREVFDRLFWFSRAVHAVLRLFLAVVSTSKPGCTCVRAQTDTTPRAIAV